MRALSWKQPFGTLMLYGKIETRKWKTDYRGPVLICISKKSYSLDELHDLCGEYVVHIIIGTLGNEPAQFDDVCGYAIAVGNLVDCKKMTPEDEDDCFIKYNPDLWCHFYENIREIKPIPFKGKQGWSTLDQSFIDKIEYINHEKTLLDILL